MSEKIENSKMMNSDIELRIKMEAVYQDIITNAYDFAYGVATIDEFMSAHNFYFTWFNDYPIEKQNFFNILVAFKINDSIHDYLDEEPTVKAKDKLREDILEAIDLYQLVLDVC